VGTICNVTTQWDSVAGPAVGAAIALTAGLIGILVKGSIDRGEWRRDRRLQAYVDFAHHATVIEVLIQRHALAGAAPVDQAQDDLYRVFHDFMRSYAQVDLLAPKDVADSGDRLVKALTDQLGPYLDTSQAFPTEEQHLAAFDRADALVAEFSAKARRSIGTQ